MGVSGIASIKQRGERKFKITVCNGYRPGGQKRMQSRTIDVPKEIPKRSVMQYVYAEAQKLEKRFRCGMDEDDRTTFEQYAESWLKRQTHYKPSTLAGYQRELKIVYPFIGGIALNKLRPLILEEMCAELRKRKSATANRCVKPRYASISRRSRRCWRTQSGTTFCSTTLPIG